MPQYKHILTDFKDLRKVIDEITTAKPAETRYQQQAKKMNYRQQNEAEAQGVDKKKAGNLKKMKDHAGEEEIKKAYLELGTAAQGSVEFQRKLIQKKLKEMGFNTYSKLAFDTVFNRPLQKEDIEKLFTLTEAFSDKQIKKLRSSYKGVGTVDPSSSSGKALLNKFQSMQKDELMDIAAAGINFLSLLAASQLISKFGMKAGQFKYQQAGESVNEYVVLDTGLEKALKKFKVKFSKDLKSIKEGGMKRLFDDLENGMNAQQIAKKYGLDIKTAKSFVADYKKIEKAPRLRAAQNDPMKEANLQEGTWKVPHSKDEMKMLNKMMKKPLIIKTFGDEEKAQFSLGKYIGDDNVYDDWSKMLKKHESGSAAMDARDAVVKFLTDWGFKVKNYQITHFPESILEDGLQERGNLRKPKRGKLLKLENDPSREDRLKEQKEHAKQSPFKLKSEQYPRAIAINTDGFGKRHATVEDIISACDSFGMIIDKELQVEQIQKVLGKKGFITYKKCELEDIFEERQTERMILALESDVEEQEPIEYVQGEVAYAQLHERELEFLKPDGQKAKGPVLKMSGNTFNIKDKFTGKSFTYKYSGKDVKLEEGKVKTFKDIAEVNQASLSVAHKGGNITKMVKQFDKWVKFSHEGPSKYKFTGSKDKIEMIKKYIDTGKLGKSSYQKWPNEENVQEIILHPNDIRKDFPNVWAQKSEKLNNILIAIVDRDGYAINVKSYKKDRKKFVDSLKSIAKSDANLKKAGLSKKDIGEEEIQEGRFSKQLIKQAGGIAFDKRYYMGNMTGAVKAIEKLKKGLSDDPKVREMLRIANESNETTDYTNWLPEGGDKEAYKKFFNAALKKFGVSSPDELEGEKKKKFFDYVDKNWKGDHEEVETKLDGRRKNFREKMKKLGYIKGE